MMPTIWLAASTLYYPDGGGYFWIFLNWALGLQSLGYRVVWLEIAQPETAANELAALVATLRSRLDHYGLAGSLAIFPKFAAGIDVAEIARADLLLNLSYGMCGPLVERFRRSALVDIDPGLTQIWLSEGNLSLPRHDLYFTIGEHVGQPGSPTPGVGIQWRHTPPCVSLEHWPIAPAEAGAAWTTVSNWQTSCEWVSFGDDVYHNDKRSGFLPYQALPRRTSAPLELALCLGDDEAEEVREWESFGWRIRPADDVAATPGDFQAYVRQSQGEFSCAKPSYARMQNAWLSDRTVCYLASGKPAVVEHTGPSDILPDDEGLLRFRSLDEAAQLLERATVDYDRQCRAARALAERHFDAARVARRVVEQALD